MSVSTILRGKAAGVFSVLPTDTVATIVAVLAEKRVGALLVLDKAQQLLGIVSERDVMRGLATDGANALDMTAAMLMTRVVHTIKPETDVQAAMELMTTARVRHLPVVDGGRLIGMVSIGDVVKERLDQQAHEVDTLRDYVTGRG
jgi:CBS domain-containing protein